MALGGWLRFSSVFVYTSQVLAHLVGLRCVWRHPNQVDADRCFRSPSREALFRDTPLPIAYYNEDVADTLLRSSERAWDDLRALSIAPAVLDCEYIDYVLLGRRASSVNIAGAWL